MEPIIQIKNIGKRYQIRHYQGGYVALRDVIASSLKNPLRFIKEKAKSVIGKGTKEAFWALKDVSLDIMPGEIIGVIGRNGAGKSTLLKILTGITPPTTGEIVMRGRTASLLEVGTGFHPELTGRENIFLNGAILGMTRVEIAKNFTSIVEFAEVEKFLDTPVKFYSSGMYVRLAFAVAAHMEPDILLVDEVLAVGDSEFQKKCLGKMEEVTRTQGRTIIFVSHNMAAIEQLCKRCVIIEKGMVKKISSDVPGTIKEYLRGGGDQTQNGEWVRTDKHHDNEWFRPARMYVSDGSAVPATDPLRNDSPIKVTIEADIDVLDPALTIGYALYDSTESLLYWSYQTDADAAAWPKLKKGRNILHSTIPPHLLNEGEYRLELIGGLHNRAWMFEPNKGNPTVSFSIRGGLSTSTYWTAKRPGTLAPIMPWKI